MGSTKGRPSVSMDGTWIVNASESGYLSVWNVSDAFLSQTKTEDGKQEQEDNPQIKDRQEDQLRGERITTPSTIPLCSSFISADGSFIAAANILGEISFLLPLGCPPEDVIL